MNSLNLISSRVIGQSQPSRPRSHSQGDLLKKDYSDEAPRGRTYTDEHVPQIKKEPNSQFPLLFTRDPASPDDETPVKDEDDQDDEKTPLLHLDDRKSGSEWDNGWRCYVKSLADVITAILAAIGAPVVYIARCFRTQDGRFSIVPRPPRRDRSSLSGTTKAIGLSSAAKDSTWSSEKPEKAANRALLDAKLHHSYSSDSLNTLSSDSDNDIHKADQAHAQAKPKREKAPRQESETRRSSIRIKEQNDAVKRRKQKKAASPLADATPLTVDNIKSPRSPSPSLRITRYPHAPQPPRPLIPRRQPSYSNLIPRSPGRGAPLQQKTLVLDLDETLIHSLAKGGRMSSGHMVEVKLNAPVALSAPQPGQATPVIGPQHPILYYVHKRPHCDEFLRKVSKWFKLVVFTASVQEYADPVIDWLEVERKHFVGRYYRQHCTFRNGAYIKDLSSIEPDLSKVIILDNSPVSYIFHEGEFAAGLESMLDA
jgi:CTD nuclear envelope phosphatase 1